MKSDSDLHWRRDAKRCTRWKRRNHWSRRRRPRECFCEWEVIVQGDEGPVGGVAQVLCHGVIVVVGHQEGQEEVGEKQGEVEGEVEKLKDNRSSWMVWRWGERQVRTALSHVECDE